MREKGRPELSVILAFNVKVDPEAEKEAKTLGVKIMTAEIIYHLFDDFTKYFQQVKDEKKLVIVSGDCDIEFLGPGTSECAISAVH